MIYLDNNATTKLDPAVLAAMLPFLEESYANSGSSHLAGLEVAEALIAARLQVANAINAKPHEIIFTSSATEAINLAFKGLFDASFDLKPHVITLQTEHKAVLNTCEYLQKKGLEVTYLPVQTDGLVDLEAFKNAFRPNTKLVSVMWVNNETGVQQPIKQLAEITKQQGAYFMTDATQAFGKIPIDVADFEIDILSLSAHKFHGPKGVGALFLKQGIVLENLLHGGSQERGRRASTSNVPAIVGMGHAADLALEAVLLNHLKIKILRDELEQKLLEIPNATLNGHRTQRLYNVSNICFENCDAENLIMALGQVMVSSGSACTAATVEPSHVLLAMGVSAERALASIRISLSKFTTKEEIEEAFFVIKSAVEMLRSR